MMDYTRQELEGMKIADLKALASESGLSIKSTKKADIIGEMMEAKECTQTMSITSSRTVVIF